jgi:hypothetical protein
MGTPLQPSTTHTITTADGVKAIEISQSADGVWHATDGDVELPVTAATHPDLLIAIGDHFTTTEQPQQPQQASPLPASGIIPPDAAVPSIESPTPDASLWPPVVVTDASGTVGKSVGVNVPPAPPGNSFTQTPADAPATDAPKTDTTS